MRKGIALTLLVVTKAETRIQIKIRVALVAFPSPIITRCTVTVTIYAIVVTVVEFS